MQAIYLIRFGEIALKGDNRIFFEKMLKLNMRKNLGVKNARILQRAGRFYIETPEEHAAEVERALSHTFGIVGFSRARRVQKDIEIIERASKKVIIDMIAAGDIDPDSAVSTSFKIESRRTDKSFPLDSYGIACRIGDTLRTEFDFLTVDVHEPDFSLFIEIREEAFIYGSLRPGLGGLPTGTAGRGLLMLSGGIDSPVAGYMMAKRGLKLDFIYFHTYPYTSEEVLDKVRQLASILSSYCCGANLFVIPFTPVQLRINERAKPEEITLLMRAAMVKIGTRIARRRSAGCLITGESLSQVASQTVESITFTGSATNLPIFRPLIGLDKEQIIRQARTIGTFETSILPYDDCCTVFSTDHPLLHPHMGRMNNAWENLEIEDLLKQAADSAERIYFHPIYGEKQANQTD